MDTELQQTGAKPLSRGGNSDTGRQRTLRRTAIAVGILVALAAVGWGFQQRGKSAPAAQQGTALPEVTVATPLVRDLEARLGALGQFSAVQRVELRAQVGGPLVGIHFKDGDIVQKGALLFTIESRPYDIRLAQAKAQLETAKARLTLAESEFQRAQALERTSAGSVQNLEQRSADRQVAQAAVAEARSAVDDAQFDVDRCRIVAPFTGRIGTHLVSIGNLISGSRAATSATTLLATLVSLDPIYFDFDISEADYQLLSTYRSKSDKKAALTNTVEIALGTEKSYSRKGVLDFINNVLDRSSGTIRARATVANADYRLTPGEFARVRLALDQPAPTMLVPDRAVLPDQSQFVVLTVTPDGTVAPKIVQVGDVRDGMRVIRGGLAATDRVIIGGIPYAAPGAKVAVKTGEIRIDAKGDGNNAATGSKG
ncbi:efflux RND transporter periplasmic adaptor subunit [Cupriavidus plantarum]|uniref:efflux RND transporter periplasmic adaptor subunit n=1 Tax=Cupriavidus plantarum TaxID=942865 RepID=UPI000E25155E|nr:efflux RND transporter periplasmic adaptor subunit [Cupriavidus plantarum]NYI00443.1 RND family efflux transporter MFP subunit [Cupriavidus plantarum]REE93293.1 RND family efflux transporter MFP subunit [Cupriavidus plantarum]